MAQDKYTRFMLYTSDDKDDMEYPISTATLQGVFDTYIEASTAWVNECEEEYGAIIEVEIVALKTDFLSVHDSLKSSDE